MAVWHELYNGTCAIEWARPLLFRPAVTFVRRGLRSAFHRVVGQEARLSSLGWRLSEDALEPRQAIAVQSGS